jgi:hypothetical protein
MRKRLIFILLVAAVLVGICYAATIKYSYPAETTYLATDGYDAGAADDLAADSAYDYGADIDMETNGYMVNTVFLEYDSSGTTDNIVISFFGSYDGLTFDDSPVWTFEVDATSGNDEQISFQMNPAYPHGRIGVKTTGTTDTFDYRITYLPARGDAT